MTTPAVKTQGATRIMPAGITQKSHPRTGKDRREVNAVALFEIRRDAKRAPERLSEAEKAVRLESALRQRQHQHQADKAALVASLFRLRSNR